MDTLICNKIIEYLTDGIVVIDKQFCLIDINPAACRISNITNDSILGRPIKDVFAETPKLVRAIQNAKQSEQEIKITHEQGTYCITLRLQPLIDPHGELSGYAVIFRDTTNQKSTEHELEYQARTRSAELCSTSEQLLQEMGERDKLEEELRQSRKMEAVGRLTDGVTHDFANLLTAILGSAELGMQESKSDSNTHRLFLNIKNGALIATDLTRKLLNFGRKQQLKRKYLSLNHVISDTVQMLNRILGEDIKLNVQLTPGLYAVFADPDQIQLLITNLCTSTRDTIPNGGEITLRTDNLSSTTAINTAPNIDKESSYVLITFAYKGYAVSEDSYPYSTESHQLTFPSDNSTNLGLAVVKGIIRQHEGHLSINSRDAGGTIKVYLPATPNTELAMNSIKSDVPLRGGYETILLVEDNDMVLNVTMRLLDDLGYTTLIAHDADEAMELFQKNMSKIDLIMSDVVMPRSSGPEMFSRMHAMQPELPALFATGYDVNQSIETLETLECYENCAVLQKPYSHSDLAEKLRELLAKQTA